MSQSAFVEAEPVATTIPADGSPARPIIGSLALSLATLDNERHNLVDYSVNLHCNLGGGIAVRSPSLFASDTKRYDRAAAPSMFTAPNLLSGSRLVLTPVLFALAWHGRETMFLSCLVIALLSDVLDGWLVRRLGGGSNFGTTLDSWADIALCLSVPLEVWWLWPDLVRREAEFVGAVVVCYAVPALFALLKHGRLPSYHTWMAKLAGVLMGIGGLVLLAGGPAWAFHFAALVVLIEAIEEMAITVVLPQRKSNVPSFWHALLMARRGRAAF